MPVTIEDLPTITRPWLRLDGRNLPQLDNQCTSVRIEAALNQPMRLQVDLDQAGAQAALGAASLAGLWPLLAPGRTIALALDGQGLDLLFSGRIVATGLSCPSGQRPVVQLQAADGLQPLADAVRRRTLAAGTDASRVRTIAAAHGLAVQLDWPGATRPALVQLDESDLALLQRLARAAGRRVWVDGLAIPPALCAGPLSVAPRIGIPNLAMGQQLLSLQLWQDKRSGATAWRATARAGGAWPRLQPGHLVRVSPWPAAQAADLTIASLTRCFNLSEGACTELELQSTPG